MLKGMRVGSNDLDRSRRFYDATFEALGVSAGVQPEGASIVMYALPGGQNFLFGTPRDQAAAVPANGATIVFAASSAEAVSAWHAAGMAQGGQDEGQPEAKPQAGGAFGAYMRDPDGNKLCVYHGI